MYANDQAALELEVQPDIVIVGAATNRDSVGELRLHRDGRRVARWPMVLRPGEASVQIWPRTGSARSQWTLRLLDSDNLVVAEWSSVSK